MLENIEGAIKNGQSRETGNIDEDNKAKSQHNMCWTPLYANNTNNVSKNWALQQTTGGNDELNFVFMWKS